MITRKDYDKMEEESLDHLRKIAAMDNPDTTVDTKVQARKIILEHVSRVRGKKPPTAKMEEW